MTVHQAIAKALAHNQTVLYGARLNMLNAATQRQSADAAYRPSLSIRLNASRSGSITQIPGMENVQDYRYQQLYPDLDVRQTILTPFGSKVSISGAVQTMLTGFNSLTYQTLPTLGLSYEQPLSWAGIVAGHADIVQADLALENSRRSFRLQQEQLVLSVLQSYFQLWQSTRTVEQSINDEESARRILEIAEVKLRSGTIAEFEVLNLRVQRRLAEDNLLQVRNLSKTQTISFMRLLGEAVDSSFKLTEHFKVDSLNVSLDSAVAGALMNRMELKQARDALTLARLNRGVVSSAISPVFGLNLSYNLRSNMESTFFRSLAMPNYGWGISGSITIPLLDGGQTALQTESADRSIAIQEMNIKLLEEEIRIEVETRYRTLQLNFRRMGSLELSLASAAEALKIAELRFQSGEISSTEIENVRNRHNASRNALDGVRISHVLERAALAKAMGGLMDWVESLKGTE
jgi:outer membrane protein TolC